MSDTKTQEAGHTKRPLQRDCSAERRDKLLKLCEAIHSGYGGVLPNGQVVDRREQPHAMSIPANPSLDTPEPRPAIEQDCPDCYGGLFRRCQMCGDTGKVVFLPNNEVRHGGRKPAIPKTVGVKALASATGSTACPDWILTLDKMPPNCVRVMTYSPQPINAVRNLADGVAIQCWNADEKRWCDDYGETSMFTPTAWWSITIPIKKR